MLVANPTRCMYCSLLTLRCATSARRHSGQTQSESHATRHSRRQTDSCNTHTQLVGRSTVELETRRTRDAYLLTRSCVVRLQLRRRAIWRDSWRPEPHTASGSAHPPPIIQDPLCNEHAPFCLCALFVPPLHASPSFHALHALHAHAPGGRA